MSGTFTEEQLGRMPLHVQERFRAMGRVPMTPAEQAAQDARDAAQVAKSNDALAARLDALETRVEALEP